MAYTQGSGRAVISMGVDGDAETRRRIETVGDALGRLDSSTFNRLVGQIGAIHQSFDELKSSITAIAQLSIAGISVGTFAAMIQGSIDAADNLNDLSKTTSVTVRDLSGLKLAAQQSGAELEGTASAINKLSVNMGKDAERFATLGVTAKDPIEAFKQLSDVVSAIDDPQLRAALSAAAIGRSWESAAPLLAEGSARIGEMIDKGRELAGVNQEMADRADEFNDKMAEMGTAVDGLKMKIANDLLPGLTETADQMNRAYEQSGLLYMGLMALNGLGAMLYSDDFASAEVQMKNLRKELAGINSDLALSKNAPAVGFVGRWLFGESRESLEVEADAIRAQIWALQEELDRPARLAADKTAEAEKDRAAKEKAAKEAADKAAAFLAGEEARKAGEAAARKEAALLAQVVGLTSTFAAEWDALSAVYGKGKISLEQLTRAQAELLAKQPAMAAAAAAEAKARDALENANKDYTKGLEATSKLHAKAVDEAMKEAAENEALARTYGLTKTAIEQLELVRLEQQLAQRASTGLTLDEIAVLEKLIDAKKRSAAAVATMEGVDQQKKAWESIEQTAHDTFVSIFDSGKSAFDRLRDTLKNGLMDMLYQMTVKKWIVQIAGSVTGGGVGSIAQAATTAAGGSAGGGMLGSAGSIMGGVSAITGAFGSGLASGLSAWGAGGSVTGLLGSGTLMGGGIANGLGLVAGALGPIALALGAAVAIWKKLDTSGTYHTGGAAQASSAGVTTIGASSLNMENIRSNADTQKLVGELAQGVVGILDSTALAFGKTAGYTAATAFADDTSKDGAWGSLVITKLGQSIVNWQDTRGGGKWAQKTFADGEAGQQQYLAALSTSVRTALNGIGLPEWAKKMLDGVASSATLDELAKVVDQVNLTQRALSSMKEQLPGFKGLTDSAVSALMAASGGIEALAANAGAYFDNFMSEGEKSAATIKQITEALAVVGITAPTSHQAFKELVEQQMKLGEAGAPAVAMLFKVAGAFAQVYPAMEATADSARSAADVLRERAELQERIDNATLSDAAKAAKERAKYDPSLRSMFDQARAAEAARAAQDAARDSLGDLIDRMTSFGDSARTLRDSLLTGSLSTLTPDQQYAELRNQYESTKAAALAGDAAAQGRFSEALTSFLTLSQQINGGDDRYTDDFAMGRRDADMMARWADGQVDVAQASLDAMKDQVSGIAALNTIMAQVAQGVQDLPAALAAASAQAMAAPLNYSAMGTGGMTSLANEIKALRAANEALAASNAAIQAELKGLRAEQNTQTGHLITSNAQALQRAGSAIVSGFGAVVNERVTARNSAGELE